MKTAAPERKSSKTLKGQLFGAISMMLVAVIALGTSTYAWFINNQTVEVQTMNLTVSTATSLLAAVGKPDSVAAYNTAYSQDNYTNFKTVISPSDITGTIDATNNFAGWSGFLTGKLVPASVTSASLGAASSANFPSFYKSMDALTNGQVSNFELLTHDTASTSTGLGQGAVKHLRLAMMGSASDLNVYLGKAGTNGVANTLDLASLVTASPNTGLPDGGVVNGKDLDAQAAAIRSALRVAIVPVSATANAAPPVFQFDQGENAFTRNGNNTYYGAGVTGSVTVDETAGVYKAVSTVDSGGLITTVDALNAARPTKATAPTYTNPYIATVTNVDGVYTVVGATKELFTLTANTEQIVDIYIWLEGTDKDCLNEMSNYHFGLSIPFVAAVKPAP